MLHPRPDLSPKPASSPASRAPVPQTQSEKPLRHHLFQSWGPRLPPPEPVGGWGKGGQNFPRTLSTGPVQGLGGAGWLVVPQPGPVITVSSPAPMRGRQRAGLRWRLASPRTSEAAYPSEPLSGPAGPRLPTRLLPGPGSRGNSASVRGDAPCLASPGHSPPLPPRRPPQPELRPRQCASLSLGPHPAGVLQRLTGGSPQAAHMCPCPPLA